MVKDQIRNTYPEDERPLITLEKEGYASWEEIKDFLEWNPLAATFEWADLVTKANEAETKRDEGADNWQTPKWLFFHI